MASPVSPAAVIHPASASPVVALTVILLLVAVTGVLLVSYLLYWRSGKR
jgi:hypothetical protein